MTSSQPASTTSGHLSLDMLGAPGVVLLDDWDIESGAGVTYLFQNPSAVIVCDSHDHLRASFQSIADHQSKSKYVAGYIAYDAGVGLDKPLQSQHTPQVPLLWMGVYDSCTELDRTDARFCEWDPGGAIGDQSLNVNDGEYIDCIDHIKRYIEAGDVYQVNYTCKLRFQNSGTAAGLFARLRKAHPVCHSAFINTGEFQVISISPELFLRRKGGRLVSRPMKGTSPRGRFTEEDARLADALHNDIKNRAENLMILDLMRNDLGRISDYGSVTVADMFRVERYRSVLQMTSEVSSVIRADVGIPDLIAATFPPGSITGAPKSRAIEIIDELEHESRGVYCGCIGVFRPDGDALLNVAIRTIVQRGHSCEMGVGGGIVADSDPQSELDEALLKASFLRSEPAAFDLLETLLFQPGQGFTYLEEHLARMRSSAAFFGYRFDEAQARSALDEVAATIAASDSASTDSFRVRLLASEDGSARTEWSRIDLRYDGPVRIIIAERKTDPDDVFLYHKTTNREAYDSDLAGAKAHGFTDTLYTNAHGHLTECAVTNIAVRLGGRWYTPPVECGLLPGIWRADLQRSDIADERVLTLDDLAAAEEVMIGNSVRGAIRVGTVHAPDGRVVFEFQDRQGAGQEHRCPKS